MNVQRWTPNAEELVRIAEHWLKMTEPHWMAFLARERAPHPPSARKWKLLGCAFARTCLPLLSCAEATEAVAVCERAADEAVPVEQLHAARQVFGRFRPPPHDSRRDRAVRAFEAMFTTTAEDWPQHGMACILQVHRSPESRRLLCAIARDVLIDALRPVAFDPAWRSESAVALARAAYESRNFTLLPILADALEEAGCDNAEVLAHCRQPDATHVRGCWVVDLVLGKS